MDAVRIGLSIRALRRRRGWTQAELGRRAGFSGSKISRIERGRAGWTSIRQLERILEVLGARLHVRVLWQGEELDRLLDRDHATIVEALVGILSRYGWVVVPEATFHIGGERGSVDVLAWHPKSSTLLVVEVKSVVPDVQGTLMGIDRKARLAPTIAAERGWGVRAVGRVLVLPDDRGARRRIATYRATFDRVLPARTAEVKRWLRAPNGPLSGVQLLSNLPPPQARQRIGRPGRGATLGSSPHS